MGVKILFVDDEPGNSENYMEYFRMFGFAETDEVRTPKAAIERIESAKPDIAFLDISLGEQEPLTGMDVLKAVRTTVPRCKIVMLSAHEHYKTEALASGADGYLLKPCRPRALLEVARQASGGEA